MNSAVVANVDSEVQLEHVSTHEKIRGWVPQKKLVNSLRIESKDKVVYNDWIGTVEDVSAAHMRVRQMRPIGLSGWFG